MTADIWDMLVSADEAANLRIKSKLMMHVTRVVRGQGGTQKEIAQYVGITQPRLNDLLKGKIDKFSIEALVEIARRVGITATIELREANASDEELSVSAYIDSIAPEHDRTSCGDFDLYNAAYGPDDHDGKGRCYRCTLIAAMRSSQPDHHFNKSDDKESEE